MDLYWEPIAGRVVYELVEAKRVETRLQEFLWHLASGPWSVSWSLPGYGMQTELAAITCVQDLKALACACRSATASTQQYLLLVGFRLCPCLASFDQWSGYARILADSVTVDDCGYPPTDLLVFMGTCSEDYARITELLFELQFETPYIHGNWQWTFWF